MKHPKIYLTLAFLLLNMLPSMAQNTPTTNEKQQEKLVVVWTSDDPYVAYRVALMYTHAAKNNDWFNEVTLIIWGPSAKLTSENLKIQEKLHTMQKDGVEIRACIACANAYGIADDLKKLGFEVDGMGKPLTDYLKDPSTHVITF